MRLPALPFWLRAVAVVSLLQLVFACEEPVDLDIDIPRSRLVINSNFIPNELVSLRVSATRPLGTTEIPVIDAQVALFEGTELAERLTFEAGSYRTSRFKPRVGQQYTIHVSADGYDPVTAVSSIPDPVEIISLSVHNLTTTESGPHTIYDYRLEVDYADPPDATNFYDLRIYQRVLPYELSATGDTLLRTPYLKPVSTPGGLVEAHSTVSILLKDKAVGQNLHLALRGRLTTNSELLNGLVAELRTVSPEYFYYQRSLAVHHPGLTGGLNEPIIIYNNVVSGLGIFAGYNSVKQNLDFLYYR